MGLRLKCPGCQANNPLSLRVCPVCGRSLDNLPPEQRVYVLEPFGAPLPSAAPSPAPAPKQAAKPPTEAPGKAAKKPKRPRKPKG
jgi:hypothetical protein